MVGLQPRLGKEQVVVLLGGIIMEVGLDLILVVRAFAGHVDEETTLKYCTFDREDDEKRNKQFEEALSYDSKR